MKQCQKKPKGTELLTVLLCSAALVGCGSSQVRQGGSLRTVFPSDSRSTEPGQTTTAVDMSYYAAATSNSADVATATSPSVRQFRLSAISGSETAVAVVRQGHRYELPFDGVCLNAAAEAVIEASFNEQARLGRVEADYAVRLLAARAVRDLQTQQSDHNLVRSVMQARISDRDIELTAASRIIQQLETERNGTLLQRLGWAGIGAVAGLVVAGTVAIAVVLR